MIKDRLKQLRAALSLTQSEFATRLGMAQNSIANYEIGRREPTNQTITSICREFNVNEEWLRTGNGDMFIETSLDDEFMQTATQIAFRGDEQIKNAIIQYWKLPEEFRRQLWNFIDTLTNLNREEEGKKKEPDQ